MEKTNKSHMRFAEIRYRLEIFMLGRGDVGARIALWLSIFWLRFLYNLGPVKKFTLDISPKHPLIDDLDSNLMSVGKGGVNGEYARLVHEMRRYLDIQQDRISDLPPERQFPSPNFWDKLFAFISAFSPSSAGPAFQVNVYTDVD
jgi:hypothetical protein